MDKSFVTMEQKVCICCGKPEDTGALLLDRTLKPRFEMHTATGWTVCKNCKKEGYVLLIEADPEKSFIPFGDKSKPENTHKTGVVVHIREAMFKEIFGEIPPQGVAYIEPEVTKKLQAMMEAE